MKRAARHENEIQYIKEQKEMKRCQIRLRGNIRKACKSHHDLVVYKYAICCEGTLPMMTQHL